MPEENTTAQNQKKGGSKKKVIIIISVIALIAVLVGVIIYLLLSRPREEENEEMRAVIAPDNVDAAIEEIESYEPSDAPQSYIVTQNSDWIFTSWDQPSLNAYVENDEFNETAVYFDLILNSTGEVIYSSPVLVQGAHIEGFALTKPVENGSYDCMVEYHLIDENQETLTTSTVGVHIQVGN